MARKNPVRKSGWGGEAAKPISFKIEAPYVRQSRNYYVFQVQDKPEDADLILTIYLRTGKVEDVADPTHGLHISGFIEEEG